MFSDELNMLKKQALHRTITDREGVQGRTITFGGREHLNFASNDYLGLASDARLRQSAREAIDRYGIGAGASRLLGGGTLEHAHCELLCARLKSAQAALLFGSGYSANTGAIPALAKAADAIFSDELNHASLIDACRLSRADVHIYRHRDTGHLARLMDSTEAHRKLVITDTVFSMTGAIAPLPAIYDLCRARGAMLYLDDAHGTGVLGAGKGGLAHFGLAPEPWVIQMATCSKALGAQGAFIAGSADTIDWLINTARSFMYSTAQPPCIPAAVAASIEVLTGPDGVALLGRLWDNQRLLTDALRKAAIRFEDNATPIIPVTVGNIDETLALSKRLMDLGIYAPAIRPPTVSAPIIRITVTASHTPADIEALLSALSSKP